MIRPVAVKLALRLLKIARRFYKESVGFINSHPLFMGDGGFMTSRKSRTFGLAAERRFYTMCAAAGQGKASFGVNRSAWQCEPQRPIV
jgi:hypothetical protein